jgi:hypothetical protein
LRACLTEPRHAAGHEGNFSRQALIHDDNVCRGLR